MVTGFLFPSVEVRFRSRLTPEQARKALAANVNVKGIRNTFYWPRTERRPFRGRLRDLTFVLALDTTPTSVIVKGSLMREADDRTIVALKMTSASLFTILNFEARAFKAELKLREIFRA